LAFDGQNIWTTNRTANSVTKVRASDGAILANLKGFNYPFAIAFDGVSIWVGNTGDNTVIKLNPATGAITNSFSLATGPIGMAFDGVSMWLGYTDGSVIKLTNNAVTAQLSVGFARALAFDGTNIWVTNYTSGYVFKINAAQASIAAVIPSGGNHPAGIAFDGNSVWVANQDGPVTQILPGGATRTHGSHQLCPSAVAFDGVNIWVSNSISNTVSKF
jgi:YVTN family beta-propeller protein